MTERQPEAVAAEEGGDVRNDENDVRCTHLRGGGMADPWARCKEKVEAGVKDNYTARRGGQENSGEIVLL